MTIQSIRSPSNCARAVARITVALFTLACTEPTAPPPAKYVVSSSDANPVAGAQVVITAQLVDDHNNPVSLPGRTVTWSDTDGGGHFESKDIHDADGRQRFDDVHDERRRRRRPQDCRRRCRQHQRDGG